MNAKINRKKEIPTAQSTINNSDCLTILLLDLNGEHLSFGIYI